MTRVTFDARALEQLEKVRAVPLGQAYQVHVRLLPGSVFEEFAQTEALAPGQRGLAMLALMLCDEHGKSMQLTRDDLAAWPAGYITQALAAGLELNGIGNDDPE